MKIYLKIVLLTLLAFMPGLIMAQSERTLVVQGTITAAIDDEPLIAVNVSEVNPSNRVVNGVTSDFNGHYVIRMKDPNNRLVFSYMGFKTQTVKVGSNRSTYKIGR